MNSRPQRLASWQLARAVPIIVLAAFIGIGVTVAAHAQESSPALNAQQKSSAEKSGKGKGSGGGTKGDKSGGANKGKGKNRDHEKTDSPEESGKAKAGKHAAEKNDGGKQRSDGASDDEHGGKIRCPPGQTLDKRSKGCF